jgi:hypothetical protein
MEPSKTKHSICLGHESFDPCLSMERGSVSLHEGIEQAPVNVSVKKRKISSSCLDNNITVSNNSLLDGVEEYGDMNDSDDDDNKLTHYINMLREKNGECDNQKQPLIPSSIPKINLSNLGNVSKKLASPLSYSSTNISLDTPLASTLLKRDFGFVGDKDYNKDEFSDNDSNYVRGYDGRFRKRIAGDRMLSKSSQEKMIIFGSRRLVKGGFNTLHISSKKKKRKSNPFIKIPLESNVDIKNTNLKDLSIDNPFPIVLEKSKKNSLKRRRVPQFSSFPPILNVSEELTIEGGLRRGSARIKDEVKFHQLLGLEV